MKNKNEDMGIVDAALRSFGRLYVRFNACKRAANYKKTKSIQNINHLNISPGVKFEIESRLYDDLESSEKRKFRSN